MRRPEEEVSSPWSGPGENIRGQVWGSHLDGSGGIGPGLPAREQGDDLLGPGLCLSQSAASLWVQQCGRRGH